MQTDGTPDSMRPPSVARQNRHINVTYFRTFYRFAFDAAPILLEVLLLADGDNSVATHYHADF